MQRPHDIEIVDIADDAPPSTSCGIAAKDYRKLHDPYMKVHGNDDSFRVLNEKQGCSYAKGSQAGLPFIQTHNETPYLSQIDQIGEDDEAGLPSLSALVEEEDFCVTADQQHSLFAEGGPKETSPGDEYGVAEDYETAMIGIDDSMMLQNSADSLKVQKIGTPVLDYSFANRVFDFESFDDETSDNAAFRPPVQLEDLNEDDNPDVVKVGDDRRAEPTMVDREPSVPRDETIGPQHVVELPAWASTIEQDSQWVFDFLGSSVDYVDEP